MRLPRVFSFFGIIAFASACSEQPVPVEPPVASAAGGAGLQGAPLPAVVVVTGAVHACALGVDRRTYCWGGNTLGQLGDGSNMSSTRPVPVAGGLHFVQLTSGGWDHTCGLTDEGEAYCWGWNAFGQLGDGSMTSSNVPVRAAANLTFTNLDAGTYHTCGVTRAGAAYCWGANGPLNGAFSGVPSSAGFALGAPTTASCTNPATVAGGAPYRGSPWPCSPAPLAVSGGVSFRSISAGLWATCGVAVSGVAYCWGLNFGYQLGNNALAGATTPTPVAGGWLFDEVVLGALHGCGLVNHDGYCWGGRLFNWGSLGTGSFLGSSTPAPVVGGLSFAGVIPSDANDIYTFTCGLTTEGAAYCWGANRQGALGTEVALPSCADNVAMFPCSNVPVPVAGGLKFISLAAGREFACGVSRSRATYCWGANDFGQLGDGTTTDRFTPVLVQSPGRRRGALAPAQALADVIP